MLNKLNCVLKGCILKPYKANLTFSINVCGLTVTRSCDEKGNCSPFQCSL